MNQRLYWFLIALIILCSLGSIYFFLKGGREGSELTPVSSEPKLPLPQKKLPVVSEERLPSGECRSLVESDPIGARVYMNGLFVGMTPTHVQVRCAKDIVLALERVGYVRLERKVRIVDRDSKIEINLIPIETP